MLKLINEIKYNRLPEKFLIDIVNDMTVLEQDAFKDSIFYEYKSDIIFEYDILTKRLFVNQTLIWDVFRNKYNIDHDEIGIIIKYVIETYTPIRLLSSLVRPYNMEDYWDFIINKV